MKGQNGVTTEWILFLLFFLWMGAMSVEWLGLVIAEPHFFVYKTAANSLCVGAL